MIRTTTTTLALSIAVALASYTSTAQAGVTCTTNAAAEIAAAAVNGPRAGWDPPVWTFDMPDLNMSIDVQAYTQPDAAAKAEAWLAGQIPACAVEAPVAPPAAPSGTTGTTGDTTTTSTTTDTTTTAAPTASTPTYDAPTTSQAQTIIDSATVTYRGNSWGPVPLYTVDLRPGINMTVDVAANSEADARAAVLPVVAAALGGTLVASAPSATQTPAAAADATTAPTVNPTGDTSAPGTWSGSSVITSSTVLTQSVDGANRFGTLDPALATALLSA